MKKIKFKICEKRKDTKSPPGRLKITVLKITVLKIDYQIG
jgi:hypothetical protein